MSAALHLYEISNQLQSLESLTDSDDLPAELIADTIEGLEGDFDAKAQQVAKFVLSLEANSDAIHAAAAKMAERAKRIDNRAQQIRAYLQFHMQALKRRRIEGTDVVLALKSNPPAVVVTDEHAVPERFWIQPPPPAKRLDKKAIKAAIDAGETVDGAYVEAGERLEIKP